MLAKVVQFLQRDFFTLFTNSLIINIEHAFSQLEFFVKFLDLNCIFLQGNVHYWDMFKIIHLARRDKFPLLG